MTKEEAIAFLQQLSASAHVVQAYRNEEWIEMVKNMLQNATIWTPCSERMPTKEDGDAVGRVNVNNGSGVYCDYHIDAVRLWGLVSNWSWSRIEPIGGGNG